MSPSPYSITLSKNSSFTFVTASGHTYNVYFDKSSAIFPDERVNKLTAYLGFICSPSLKVLERAHDPRVGVTVMQIIASFLFANPETILAYVCSSLDGQDRNRQISFKRWYNSSELKDKFMLMQETVGQTYCGVIYDRAHPQLEIIDESFMNFSADKLYMLEEAAELYTSLMEKNKI